MSIIRSFILYIIIEQKLGLAGLRSSKPQLVKDVITILSTDRQCNVNIWRPKSQGQWGLDVSWSRGGDCKNNKKSIFCKILNFQLWFDNQLYNINKRCSFNSPIVPTEIQGNLAYSTAVATTLRGDSETRKITKNIGILNYY